MPGVEDDDDLLPDLPPMGEEDDEELPDREELGIEDELAHIPADVQEENERVGLDDSTGLEEDEPLFALEMPPEEEASGITSEKTEESGDSRDSGEDVDAIPIEGLGGHDEYGWTDESGPASDEPWSTEEADLPSLVPLSTEDGGEEGVDEEVDLGVEGDDSVPGLPPLAADLDGGDDEGADDLVFGEDALIEEAALSFDEEQLQMGDTLPAPLEPPGCTVEHLGPTDDEIYCLELSDPPLAGGARLYRIAGRCEPFEPAGLEEREIVSIARIDADTLVVGTRLHGPLFSEDGGATFTPSAGAGEANVAQSFHLRQEAGGARLWGRSGTGALYRSEDGGRTWVGPLLLKPALAIATPDEGGVVAICAGRNAPAQLVGSVDGGERWAAVDGPPLPDGGSGELNLAVCGELVAMAADNDAGGPFLSSDGGRSWRRVPGLPPTGPMALVREPGGLSLYASHFFEGGDRGVVVRHRPGGGEAGVVLDVAEQARLLGVEDRGGGDGAHRIHALEATSDGSSTVLHVATGAGLFRVRLLPDELG